MLVDDALTWLRSLVALPEQDAARELSARFLGATEAAYRLGASEMAPAVRDAERDAVVALLRREMDGAGPLVRGTLLHVTAEIEAGQHREGT